MRSSWASKTTGGGNPFVEWVWAGKEVASGQRKKGGGMERATARRGEDGPERGKAQVRKAKIHRFYSKNKIKYIVLL
jgi:hypothetical protein